MNEIIGIDQLNENIYLNKEKIIMLYFGAEWCGPCKQLKKKLLNQNEMKDLYICYIDVDEDENKEIVEIYEVNNLPTMFFINLNEDNEIEVLNKIIGYDWIGINFAYNKIKNKVM
jgi:thiol-disulfide isomerase/thioredoxin